MLAVILKQKIWQYGAMKTLPHYHYVTPSPLKKSDKHKPWITRGFSVSLV